jgi:hypothetical protein
MRPYCLLIFLAFVSIGLHRLSAAQPQDPKQIYAQVKQPSTIHWCLPAAGDDPSGTIGNQCARYSECLGALGLQDDVDRPPFSGLSDTQVGWVRRCHQGLYDAARSNPQIKGAAATQDWLEHHVYPGTEAKPSAAPPAPR